MGCNTCETSELYGSLGGSGLKGTFTTKASEEDLAKGEMSVHVSLEKSTFSKSNSTALFHELENPVYWSIFINGRPLRASLAFIEQSNTMNQNINLVLPLSADSASWLTAPTNSFTISFHSPNGNFNSTTEENSIECHCQSLEQSTQAAIK